MLAFTDLSFLLKLVSAVVLPAFGWLILRSQPPTWQGATFIGPHRLLAQSLLAIGFIQTTAWLGCWWFGLRLPPVLLLLGLGSCAYGWSLQRSGLIYTIQGMQVRNPWGGWRSRGWDEVDFVRRASGQGQLWIAFKDGGWTEVSVFMPGWQDFLRTLARSSQVKVPELDFQMGETFRLIPHPRGPSPTLPEAVEDRLRFEFGRGADWLLEDLRAASITGSADSDALVHLAILHLMGGDCGLLHPLLTEARGDATALLRRAGLGGDDWQTVLRRRGTL